MKKLKKSKKMVEVDIGDKLPEVIGRLSGALGDLQTAARMSDGELATFLDMMARDMRGKGSNLKKDLEEIDKVFAPEKKCIEGCACKPKAPDMRSPGIDAACAQVECGQEELYKLLVVLQEKLRPILSPTLIKGEIQSPPPFPSSPLSSRIDSMVEKTETQRRLVMNLLDRLEI